MMLCSVTSEQFNRLIDKKKPVPAYDRGPACVGALKCIMTFSWEYSRPSFPLPIPIGP